MARRVWPVLGDEGGTRECSLSEEVTPAALGSLCPPNLRTAAPSLGHSFPRVTELPDLSPWSFCVWDEGGALRYLWHPPQIPVPEIIGFLFPSAQGFADIS